MLRDFNPTELDDFLGPWLTTGPNAFEPGDIPPGRSILAQNVEYKPGQVRTRYGFSPVSGLTATGDSFLSLDGWLSPTLSGTKEFIAYLATSGSSHPGFNIYDTTGTFGLTNLYAPAGAYKAGVTAVAGTRLYMTAVDANGNGTDTARVYSQTTVSATGGLDPLFQTPINPISFTGTDGGSISPALGVTVGTHNFGFLILTRNGYTTAPSPNSGSGFVPVPITMTTAGHSLTLTLDAAWPASAVAVFVIMTTADNLAQYYLVPGANAAVPGGSTFSVTIDISIDDGTLAATGTDATPFFDLFNAFNNNGVTLKPTFIGAYSSRLIFLAPDGNGVNTIFVSDPSNYQALAFSRSVIYLPGQVQATSAFNLYGNLYVVGPHWTYQTIDNGGDPVTWPTPQLIDGQIGSLSPNGVTVNSSQGIAWVADCDGLYMFSGGSYGQRPVNYYQKSDWVRINWAGAAATVKVIDSKDTQRVHVLVPLDGATAPSHIMSFDYSRGASPETINYSLDSLASYAPGAIGIIISPVDNHLEVWLGPGSITTPVLRQNDGVNESNPYRDNGMAINSTYQTGLLPRLTENVLHHVADQLRVTGNGMLSVTANNLDDTVTVPLAPIALGASPAQAITRLYHILSEAASLKLNVNALDTYFVLSALTHYSKEFVTFR